MIGEAVHFDGRCYLESTELTVMPPSSRHGLLSYWYGSTAAGGPDVAPIIGTASIDSAHHASVSVNHRPSVNGAVAALEVVLTDDPTTGNFLLRASAPSVLPHDGVWHHVLISWDTLAGVILAYLDDLPVPMAGSGSGSFDVGLGSLDWAWRVGGDERFVVTPHEAYTGDLADLFLLVGTPVDVTDPDVRARFIDPVTLLPTPCPSAPSGAAPQVFLSGGAELFPRNHPPGWSAACACRCDDGPPGGFSVVGSLTTVDRPTVAVASPTPTAPPSSSVMRAHDFCSKFGFNTNLNAGDDPAHIEADLSYLGVYNIRDHIWGGSDYPQASDFAPMLAHFASLGVRLRLHLGYQGGPSSPSYPMVDWISELKSELVVPYPDQIVGVAGPNEPDNQGFTYTDGTGGPLGWQGIAGGNRAQFDLYAAMKADLTLATIPVDEWPSAFSYSGNFAGNYGGMVNLTAASDRQNLHDYYSANNTDQPTYPADGPIYASLSDPSYGYLANNRSFCRHDRFVTTETGWVTPWGPGGQLYTSQCDDRAQARLVLCDLLDHASLPSCELVYIYKLRGSTGGNAYGVMNDDGTPKAAGTAVRNLMTILNDGGAGAATFSTTNLAHSLSGMPAQSGHHVVQKSNGSFDVLLWNETPFFNAATGADVMIASSTVTITLPVGSSGSVYDPVNGASPISTFSNVNQVIVSLNDSPLIVEVR